MELLSPPGSDRRALADALAERLDAEVVRVFHPQAEPSRVPGQPVFHSLTLGFEVRNRQGRLLARCLDDLTLLDDLDRKAAPRPGWYRVVSDDERLLELVRRQCSAEEPLEAVLEPLGRLFGTSTTPGPGGMVRLDDAAGRSVALGAPLPGERERPCELVTPPWDSDQQERLEELLSVCRELGFTAPAEGAVHIHFDGERLAQTEVFGRLVRGLDGWLGPLRDRFRTNPRCRRLGPWPPSLLELVGRPDFDRLPWEAAKRELARVKLNKYCDLNLLNLVAERAPQKTLELRTLPVHLEAGPVLEAAELMVELLNCALDPQGQFPTPPPAPPAPSTLGPPPSVPQSTLAPAPTPPSPSTTPAPTTSARVAPDSAVGRPT